ncbi:MAG: alpha/beta hydrolase [Mycobacteriales bacterium]
MATTFDLTSSDGTRIRCWRNDAPGVPLVIANGLGTTPEAWPTLVAEGSGYDAMTWYQRGTFGSERPADPARIRVEDHVEDMLALMDHQGVDRALVACWSIGVNIAFEFAHRHPDRVAGIMAVAGVPGGTFSTMGGPLRIPRRLRKPISVRAAKLGRAAGPALTWLTARIPVNERTAWLVSHSGFMLPAAKTKVVVPMLEQFLRHDWSWYGELAVAAAEHDPMDLHFVTCPVTLVAGKHDVLTSMHDVVAAAATIPHAHISVLPGSHFLPMEYPEHLHTALDDLARRAEVQKN